MTFKWTSLKDKMLKTFKYRKMNSKKFAQSNNRLLLGRIKLASIVSLFLYFYWFYADFILLKGVPSRSFHYSLITIHSLGCISSVLFLLLHKRMMKMDPKWSSIVINIYIFSYILGGALASINSQRLTGNIDAYIIILVSVAAIFPVRPVHFFFILILNHILFLLGLISMNLNDTYTLMIKQINSTGSLGIAFLISIVFYTYRINDYLNKGRIQTNEKNLHNLFDVNPFPLVLSSISSGKVILVNKKALEFYGVTANDVDTLDVGIFYKKKEERTAIIEQLNQSGSVENYVIELNIPDGSTKWVLTNFKLIHYMDENCLLSGVTDITDLKRLEKELTNHATTDMLTGILNRRKGIEILEQALSQDSEFVLCFIDINDLKEVNDQFGHAEGDYLVTTVCQVVNRNLETGDVIFRLGGDEFVILFFNKDVVQVEEIWSQLLHDFDVVNLTSNKPFTLSVSHGIFHYTPGKNVTLEEIIHEADKEMYKEKASLKGLVKI